MRCENRLVKPFLGQSRETDEEQARHDAAVSWCVSSDFLLPSGGYTTSQQLVHSLFRC